VTPQDDLPALTLGPDAESAEQQRRYAQSLLDLTNQYPSRERCFPQGQPVCEARTDRDAAGKLFVIRRLRKFK
jgi:hypothetical protein